MSCDAVGAATRLLGRGPLLGPHAFLLLGWGVTGGASAGFGPGGFGQKASSGLLGGVEARWVGVVNPSLR